MPSLQVRELPESLYQKLKQEAEKEHRTLAQQAIVTLARGLEQSVSPANKRKKLLDLIKQEELPEKLTDPVKLIREDRDR